MSSPAPRRSLLQKIKDLVIDFLADKLNKGMLRQRFEELNANPQSLPTVAISSLDIKSVERTLGLRRDITDTELEDVKAMEQIPDTLKAVLGQIERASANSPFTEASPVRWIVDTLLLNAHEIALVKVPPPTNRQVNIQTENNFKHGPVRYKRRKVELAGRPDYGIWYGHEEEFCLNALVVEAKNGDIRAGTAQALGYMGCVHRERQKVNKKNCFVYGLATDGTFFVFLKISNKSKWSSHSFHVKNGDMKLPLGLFVHILCQVATMSPGHSKESSAQTHTGEGSAESNTLPTIHEDTEMTG